MHVDFLIIAEAVDCVNSKLFIHGGAVDTFPSAGFPAVLPNLSCAVGIRCGLDGTNTPHLLTMDVLNADGASLLSAATQSFAGIPIAFGRPVGLQHGDEQLLGQAVNIGGLTIEAPGTFALIARLDGVDAKRVPFYVRQVPTLVLA